MSGIEIAGVVLAVLPLFISAWEDYQKGLEPAKAFFQWERQLPEHIRALRDAATLYEMNIETLIAPIASDKELAAMIDTSYSVLWKDPIMQKKILNRLGKASSAFQSNMQKFGMICRDIAGCLDLDRETSNTGVTRDKLDVLLAAGPKSSSRGTAKFELRRRAKFGWSKKRIKSLLKEVQECNSTMYRLTDMVMRFEPHRIRKKPPLTHHLHKVQSHANRLSWALSRAWSCTTHPSHLVGIQLECRLSGNSEDNPHHNRSHPQYSSCVLFSMAFSASEVHPHPSNCSFRELEVAVKESSAESVEESTSIDRSELAPRLRVSFAQDFENDTVVDEEALAIVNNICSTIHGNNSASKLGFYLSDAYENLRGIYPALQSQEVCFSGDAELVHLEELIPWTKLRSRPLGLTEKQRYLLSVTLASSLLQLYSTAWLEQGWCKRRVSFLRRLEGQSPNAVDVERPLLIHNFSPQPSQPPLNKPFAKQTVRESKSALLSLGILLLEIHCRETLETHFAGEGLAFNGIDDNMRLLALATSWLEQEVENLSQAQQSAVSFCLTSFVAIETDLSKAIFRNVVYDNVIEPLQEEARIFIGSSARF